MSTDKKSFYADLRSRWNASKALASSCAEAFTVAQAQGVTMSIYGFTFVAIQMRELGLDGFPGVDCKTFALWKKAGFIVKKGEKSQIDGITWVPVAGKKTESGDDKDGFLMPRSYHLFHKSQVEAL